MMMFDVVNAKVAYMKSVRFRGIGNLAGKFHRVEYYRRIINCMLEELADVYYYEEQLVEDPNRAEYYFYIEKSRKVIADYYDDLITRGYSREMIERDVYYG